MCADSHANSARSDTEAASVPRGYARRATNDLVAPPPSPAYLLIGSLTYLPARLLLRLRWNGRENVPSSGGFVLAANHLSNLDPWALGIPLFRRRYLRFMAKAELFNPLLGPIVRAAGAFPVTRGGGDVEAIATAVGLCRAGHAVVMFPEGTRRKKGVRKKWQPRPHTGAARIALEARVPLVPAALAGTDRLARLAPVRVAYGPPLVLPEAAPTSDRSAAEAVTELLMSKIAALEATL